LYIDEAREEKKDSLKFCSHCNKSKPESAFSQSKDVAKKTIWCDDCIITQRERECAKCHVIKPISEFSKSDKDPSGYAVWCKKCLSWF
ncbi:MAG: hypothetical protein EOM50_12545, partial [Erysipelotrichia bacterium]|nr:hypothetical protein [Erysipelotrichia bacterium]